MKAGDKVRLTGKWWNGINNSPNRGDVGTLKQESPNGRGWWRCEETGTYWIYLGEDGPTMKQWGAEPIKDEVAEIAEQAAELGVKAGDIFNTYWVPDGLPPTFGIRTEHSTTVAGFTVEWVENDEEGATTVTVNGSDLDPNEALALAHAIRKAVRR